MTKKKEDKYIDTIHKSTLKTLLEAIVEDHYAKGRKLLIEALYRNLSSLGRPGKLALLPGGFRQFYSPYATVDTPWDEAQELFILDG